jgi:hypothetical protein
MFRGYDYDTVPFLNTIISAGADDRALTVYTADQRIPADP